MYVDSAVGADSVNRQMYCPRSWLSYFSSLTRPTQGCQPSHTTLHCPQETMVRLKYHIPSIAIVFIYVILSQRESQPI